MVGMKIKEVRFLLGDVYSFFGLFWIFFGNWYDKDYGDVRYEGK